MVNRGKLWSYCLQRERPRMMMKNDAIIIKGWNVGDMEPWEMENHDGKWSQEMEDHSSTSFIYLFYVFFLKKLMYLLLLFCIYFFYLKTVFSYFFDFSDCIYLFFVIFF